MAVPRFNPTAALRRTTEHAARMPGQSRSSKLDISTIREHEKAIKVVKEKTSLQKRDAVERRRVEDVTDSEYWVAVCFDSRTQKEEFLRAVGLLRDGDKYIDGRKLAALFGIGLTPDPGSNRKVQINQRWLKHVQEK
jgi:hypothetical protein